MHFFCSANGFITTIINSEKYRRYMRRDQCDRIEVRSKLGCKAFCNADPSFHRNARSASLRDCGACGQRLTMIQGKIISISGTIELREGKPEINVVSADQIKGLDSQTER
jgi:hypothetical protein